MAEYHFDVQSVVVCGDIHGDFEALEALIREQTAYDDFLAYLRENGITIQ